MAEGGQTERPIVRNGPRLFSSGRVREAAFSSPFTWGRVDDAACNLQVGFKGQPERSVLRQLPRWGRGEGIIDDVRTNLRFYHSQCTRAGPTMTSQLSRETIL